VTAHGWTEIKVSIKNEERDEVRRLADDRAITMRELTMRAIRAYVQADTKPVLDRVTALETRIAQLEGKLALLSKPSR
jgi:hypothetical protein